MKDIILSPKKDLAFENGDFKIGDPQAQNLEMLLISDQGEFKATPTLGCGLARHQHGSDSLDLERTIRIQCQADGFSINQLNLNQNLSIDGEYL